MALKLGTGLGLVLMVSLVLFVMLNLIRAPSRAPAWKGNSAQLPCLADNHCPMDQKCVQGFCSEAFVSSVATGTDRSSCDAKECKGVNATCGKKAMPCAEGTFCQNDSCIPIAAPSQGEAYNQIGMILN